MSRLFGTDGIRGIANADLSPELCFRLGRAAASLLLGNRSSKERRAVIVGRDTRLSGPMLEAAITAGMTSVGCDVVSIGVVPTPAVACVTRSERAIAGVMISASHNPIDDNGIKFFGPDGFKLSDDTEDEIEALLAASNLPRPTGAGVGSASIAYNLTRHYYRELYESGVNLRGLGVIVDGAYGAAYAIAPYALRKLGATVYEIHCEADGERINVGCGATNLEPLQAAVRARIDAGENGVIGVAFDGDADRALFCDGSGRVVNGDAVLLATARDLHGRGKLSNDTVVATTMS
ncbi:MAG: phosphoglucosamine mutase, partial [Candidatus Eremiobacteraeota bacterium]|nr:phosphoglucosamine mutase [Candidatus Eremiobacteraeota bacterium]